MYAMQCPDQLALMKKLKLGADKTVPVKKQIAFLLPYLDSLKNCESAQDSVIAQLNRRIGSLYNSDKDYLNALKYYPRFIEITRANLGKPNFTAVDLMHGYYFLSQMYTGLNMKRERMMALDSCIAFSEIAKQNDQTNLAALYQKIEYYFDIGDYYLSIDYATRCETVAIQCQQVDDKDLKEAGSEYNSSSSAWKINAFLQLGHIAAAEEYIGRKIDESKKEKSNFNLGILYALLAEVQMKKSDYPKAISLFQTALKIEQAELYGLGCKQILNTLGSVVYQDYYRDEAKALKLFRKALTYQNKDKDQILSDNIESLNIYTNIAGIYVNRKQFDTAFIYFKKAFDQIKPGASEDSILSVQKPGLLQQKKVYYITNLMIAKGGALQKKYAYTGKKQYLQEALHVYRVTDQFLDMLRIEQTELESKLFWRKDTRRVYEKAIDACYVLNDLEGAFYFFEKSRAALLNDQLTHQRWVNDKDIRKEIQLTKNLLQLQRAISVTDQQDSNYSALIKEKLRQSVELERTRQQIRDENPLYYHNMVDTGSISIAYARKLLLEDHSALMEMFTGDSAAYLLVLTKGGSKLKKMDRQIYEAQVSSFNNLLSDPGVLNQQFAQFQEVSSALYSMIFQGLNIPAGRIIISPDGINFPFEALIMSTAGQTIKYLINDYATSYTYSVQFLEGTTLGTLTANHRDFFGIAPVSFAPSFQLLPLGGSDKSLDKIDQLFRYSSTVTGIKATPQKFRDEFYQYQIVQLYTHASDSGKFKEPVIYFGNSSLNLSDLVYEERPATRLIVLSACETASGKLYKGEGIFSFSRGFAALGIPSTISNLWSVENESTFKLTELFYTYLASGEPPDIALQKSKLKFYNSASREKQMPYFWAAQILSGSSDHIVTQRPWPITYKIGAIMAILVITGSVMAWRSKSSRAQGTA